MGRKTTTALDSYSCCKPPQSHAGHPMGMLSDAQVNFPQIVVFPGVPGNASGVTPNSL
jgi:hypothetical protein